ncbi:glycoside hydrolase family 99-like domain-containing protein [Pseudomonas sp. LABIM340]|uniref:glycoside hydrolase family 99-like domain-containing protein n=1 Tax=Pseudomonas sp. LABIM340 TaxID=3156585 RepID=UPI0032AFAEC6
MTKRLILVLGMHRSGTSALTRGLQALGVSLGDELYAAIAGNNDKGFFEDIETNKLNNEILQALGFEWDSLSDIPEDLILRKAIPAFEERAKELIREKLSNSAVFGLKDPRLCRLLPFWQHVLQADDVDVSYIVSLRNPLNVANSLSNRDNFDFEKSCYLWLTHLAEAVRYTEGKNRVFVSYDAILDDPEFQLRRIAIGLSLNQPSAETLIEYRDSFLDQDLRRSALGMKELEMSFQAPPVVKSLYLRLLEEADVTQSSDIRSMGDVAEESLSILKNIYPALSLVDRQQATLKQQAETLSKIEQLNTLLAQQLKDFEELSSSLARKLKDCEELNLEYGNQVTCVSEKFEMANNELNTVRHKLEANQEELSTQRELAQKERVQREEISKELKQTIEEKEKHISHIEHMHLEYAILEYKLQAVYNSRIWRMTQPLRTAANLYRSDSATRTRYFVEILRTLWRKLPLSGQTKTQIRSLLVAKEQAPTAEVVQEGVPRIIFDDSKDEFIPFRENASIEPAVKLIAFYLPQFHPFPENDQWWGKGFTEWTNVGKALPNYENHYQPHCPIHSGYYDLRVKEVMEEQSVLAKQYGIHGFSYYFYWFDSKILMDRPLEDMLQNPKVDMPFCLTWANENWTRRWDGQENDVLIGQNHSDADSLAFIRHLDKYFKDSRYIRIDGKPVLIIYRASIIPNMKETAKLWRDEALKLGHSGLYLICAQSFGIKSPVEFGFDASVEFPPHTVSSGDIRHTLQNVNPNFNGHVFSYEQVVEHAISQPEPEYKLFRTAMLSWDNTARKQLNSHIFHGFSLLRYKQWLSKIANNVFNNKKYSNEEKIIFVNAWNEWAEGTHLEPDRRFGYGYLQTTYDVIKDYDNETSEKLTPGSLVKNSENAVIVHLHYLDVWPELSRYLENFPASSFDLYVTVTSKELAAAVLAEYPHAIVRLYENRGRDILPFIRLLTEISPLNYECICKIHSKKSVYRQDGAEIRAEILDSLSESKSHVQGIVQAFKKDPELGIVAPRKYLIPHTDHNMTYCHEVVAELCKNLDIHFAYDDFPAGSMFWFRPAAIKQLIKLKPESFAPESGLADGTLPHAIERVFCVLAKTNRFKVEVI